MSEARLTLDVVPETCHFSNLRTELPKKTWDRLRKKAYRAAGFRCLICGRTGCNYPVEAHERWEYVPDGPEGPVQRLVEIMALCPQCHEVKHYGLAQIKGKDRQAREHLAEVNNWTMDDVMAHIHEEKIKFEERSCLLWDLDVSSIDDPNASFECWTKRRKKNKALKDLMAKEGHDLMSEFMSEILKQMNSVPFYNREHFPDLDPNSVTSTLNRIPTVEPQLPGKHRREVAKRLKWIPTVEPQSTKDHRDMIRRLLDVPVPVRMVRDEEVLELETKPRGEEPPRSEPDRIQMSCKVCDQPGDWVVSSTLDLYCKDHVPESEPKLAVPQVDDPDRDPLEGFKRL